MTDKKEIINFIDEQISRIGNRNIGKRQTIGLLVTIKGMVEELNNTRKIEKIIDDVFSIDGLNQCNEEMYIALDKIKGELKNENSKW